MKRHLATWVLVVWIGWPAIAALAAAPGFLWLRTAGGEAAEVSYSIAVDPAGSSFITGYFASTNLKFGSFVLTNANPPTYDAFAARFDTDGTLLWAKRMGGTNDDRARAVAVDSQDNCYVAGSFNSTNVTFGNTTLTNFAANGNSSFFTAKFDPAGNPLWASLTRASTKEPMESQRTPPATAMSPGSSTAQTPLAERISPVAGLQTSCCSSMTPTANCFGSNRQAEIPMMPGALSLWIQAATFISWQ